MEADKKDNNVLNTAERRMMQIEREFNSTVLTEMTDEQKAEDYNSLKKDFITLNNLFKAMAEGVNQCHIATSMALNKYSKMNKRG